MNYSWNFSIVNFMYHTSMYIQLNFIYHCPVILLDSQHIQEMFPFIWQLARLYLYGGINGTFWDINMFERTGFWKKSHRRILFIDPVSKFFLQKKFTEYYLFCSQTSSSRIWNPKTSDQRRYWGWKGKLLKVAFKFI